MKANQQQKNIVIVIIIGVLIVLLLNNRIYERQDIIEPQREMTYSKYYNTAVKSTTPRFTFGDSYIESTKLRWMCDRTDFEQPIGIDNTSNGSVYDTKGNKLEEVPKYQMTNRYFSVDGTPKNCWEVSLTYFDGTSIFNYMFQPGDNKQVGPFDITAEIIGQVFYGIKRISEGSNVRRYYEGEFVNPTDWRVDYKLEFIGGIATTKIVETRTNILLNVIKKVPIEIEQNIANNIKGGVYYHYIQKGITKESSGHMPFTLNKGTDVYEEYALPTNMLRKVWFEAVAFIEFDIPFGNTVRIYSEDKPEIIYNVVSELTDCISNSECKTNEICLNNRCEYGQVDPEDTYLDSPEEEDINDFKEKEQEFPIGVLITVGAGFLLLLLLLGGGGKKK